MNDAHATRRKVAIIGAGIAGLACGDCLQRHGWQVVVFEKSRGVGGRMATRRAEALQFDHGAQYFTVRDPLFQLAVDAWHDAGVVEPWMGQIRVLKHGHLSDTDSTLNRYVGAPAMNAVCKAMATDLNVHPNSRVTEASRRSAHWQLIVDGQGPIAEEFDDLVCTAPPAQTAAILGTDVVFSDEVEKTTMLPCWAVMVAFPTPIDIAADGAFVHGSKLSWIARDNAKPHRPTTADTWVLHASQDWSSEHVELEPDEALTELLEEFWIATGQPRQQPTHASAHRWRYAQPETALPRRYLLDAALFAGVCGDWCGGPRVEGAYLSGRALAEAMAARLGSASTWQ